MTNKPDLKKYLDEQIVEGCLQFIRDCLKMLAEEGATPEYIESQGQKLARIVPRMAEHFAPEDKRWALVSDIADCPGTDELKRSAMAAVAEDIIGEVALELGREVEEISNVLYQFKKNQAKQPPVA